MPRLRFISRLGIGYDMIDVEAAAARGVAVANTPDYCIEEVVAHTLALLLAGTRGVVAADRQVRAGGWAVTELAPPRCGGPRRSRSACSASAASARRCATGARALGFRVLAHDPAPAGPQRAARTSCSPPRTCSRCTCR